jgi:hypothetical protein
MVGYDGVQRDTVSQLALLELPARSRPQPIILQALLVAR